MLLPCFNEAATIGTVIDDVRASCPDADIVVFDNNSTDRSPAIAAEKNARVVRVSRQGKGNVDRAMLRRQLDYVLGNGRTRTRPSAGEFRSLRRIVTKGNTGL